MAVTTTVKLAAGVQENDILAVYKKWYNNEPFVNITKHIPETREVRGSNRCDISVKTESGRLYLFSVIDNVVKGASGQAVQNMNIRFGFEESAGLELNGEV
jgi:N-acetyl-gamma-glutamyl-phosphate reductase